MRQEIVECKTRYKANKKCPWASVVAKVDGGFMCFESKIDYIIWRSQK